jgi:PAS domain S-box-containing protein
MKNNDLYQIPEQVTKTILESISDGVFTIDQNWRITSFNRAAEKITKISRQNAIGKYCWNIFRANMCQSGCVLRHTMREGKSLVGTSTTILDGTEKRIPVVVSTALLKDENGQVIGGVETFRDMSQVEELRKELDGRFQMGNMIGRSSAMQKIFTFLPQIAQSDSTVLIQGETGTGKELMARAVHQNSHRAEKPFMAISCGALPDTLLESELFGYKAGAFTNAVRDKSGLLEAAQGGTLFLDEIGDISPAFQVRLLRVLQERSFKPLGSTQSVNIDVRIVAASNKNLSDLMADGTFRQDLYYRINVVKLELPPLRHRKEDIPILAGHFLSRLNRLKGREVDSFSQEALALLMNYHYPGNIRELENIVEHCFVLCGNGRIPPHCLPSYLVPNISLQSTDISIEKSKKAFEIQAIKESLKRNHYNRKATAEELGIHKSTLFRKIKAFQIELPKIDGRAQSKKIKGKSINCD